ncbi:MAG: hypothetical protein M3003_12115 [Candidatus Dormibacteraeota bacterium]|nr:hypothetical protein [Candidatus Dormibacteraeota bacterium]
MTTVGQPEPVAMQEFFASTTRGLVEAQQMLDDDARARMTDWDEDGIPPHAWSVAWCRLAFPIPLACTPKSGVAQTTSLWLTPSRGAQAQLAVSIRYRLSPLGED